LSLSDTIFPQLEGKYADKAAGIYSASLSSLIPIPASKGRLAFALLYMPVKKPQRRKKEEDADDEPINTRTTTTISSSVTNALISYHKPGITGTLAWSTLNTLDAKLELDENISKGLKVEALGTFKPDSKNLASKLNLYFKQPAFHMRAFVDLLKGPTATVDAVIGHEGFVVGGEAGYDVQKAAVTRYSAAIGYQHSVHSAAITATNNLSVFSASYYHRVNTQVEAGAKATWDSKGSGAVGLEVASKYIIDPTSFTKVRYCEAPDYRR